VIAKESCVLLKLDRQTFNHIVKDSASKKRETYEGFLRSVPLLTGIGQYEQSQIADALKSMQERKSS
jgi:cAMP-dependent protein kinase regulator